MPLHALISTVSPQPVSDLFQRLFVSRDRQHVPNSPPDAWMLEIISVVGKEYVSGFKSGSLVTVEERLAMCEAMNVHGCLIPNAREMVVILHNLYKVFNPMSIAHKEKTAGNNPTVQFDNFGGCEITH